MDGVSALREGVHSIFFSKLCSTLYSAPHYKLWGADYPGAINTGRAI